MRSGMLWNLVSFLFSQGSGFAIFLILAHQLPPETFGVVALASIAAEFVAVDGRYACMDAIMQSGRFDKRSLNSAFIAFLAIAGVFAVSLWMASGAVSQFYGAPLIAAFMPVFGLLLLPIPWLAVTDALMNRELAFKQQTTRSIVGTLAGGVVGIAFAFSPWLIWALVAQRIATIVATVLLQFSYTKWLPGPTISWPSVRNFVARFFPLVAIGMMNQMVNRAVVIFFGARYDALTVALVRAAERLSETLQGPVMTPLWALWFPLMSKSQGDIRAERDVYNGIVRTAAFSVFPAFAGLAMVAPQVAALFLPEQYTGVATLLRISALATMTAPIAWFHSIAMASLGMNRASLVYTGAVTAVSLAVLLCVPNVSAEVLYLIVIIPSLVLSIPGAFIVNRRLKQTNLEYYMGLLPPAIATTAMICVVEVLQVLIGGQPPIITLAASALIGAAVYCAWLVVFHRRWFEQRILMLRGRQVEA
jgi:O-antigen/teichoic acid export membrane protein